VGTRHQSEGGGEAVHLLVYAGTEAVGCVRLTMAPVGGLELESKFELSGFVESGAVLAEVTRYCVALPFRGTRVAAALFQGLVEESRRRGVSHWVAAANMQTDCAEDAAIAYGLIRERGWGNERFRARNRLELAATRGHTRRFFYSEAQRESARRGETKGLPVPTTLSLFASKMGARYMGPPAYDPYFNVFALPLVAPVSPPLLHANSAKELPKAC